MEQQKNELLPGTLNLLALKTLSAPGALHGYGIARRIEQISGDQLQLNSSRWAGSAPNGGVSENNRRAKYYSITRAGKKQLTAEEKSWRRASEIIVRFLEPTEENT